jgi:hypothetical protein
MAKVLGWIFALCILIPLAFCVIVVSNLQQHYQEEAQPRAVVHDNTPAFGIGDIEKIVADSRDNEPRFNRDYYGRRFDGTLPFKTASGGIGNYQVHFGQGEYNWDGGVYCFFSNEDLIKEMADWPKGKMIHVQGTIHSTMFRELWLEKCAVEEGQKSSAFK